MDFLTKVNTLLNTRGFDWVYCVLSHISQYANRYGASVQSYKALTRYLGHSAVNCELMVADQAPLPNGGSASFGICYRDVDEPTLTSYLRRKAANFSGNAVLIFDPTDNRINVGDTDVLVYKIENHTLSLV